MSNPIEIPRRDARTLRNIFTDVNGDVVDLTGKTLFFTVKKRAKDPDSAAFISKEVGPNEHADPENGISEVILTSSDTDIDPGVYVYEYQITPGPISSKPGRFTITQDVKHGIS